MDLNEAIDHYLTYRSSAYAKSSVTCAKQALQAFLAETGNVNTKALTPRHAERFQTSLMVKGQKPNTVNARMSQVSSFSKWLVANRYTPAHFTGTVRTVPVPKRARLRVPAKDFARLLDATDRPDRRITVALGLFLFLRSGEIRTLRVGDVHLDQGSIDVVVHKTNGFDEMPIFYELDQELRRWFIAYAADIGRPLRSDDYLVPAHKSHPGWLPRAETGNYQPNRMVIRPFDHVRATLKAAGFPVTDDTGKRNGEGVHTLRRSGARAYFEGLIDGRFGDAAARDDALRSTMSMLHHSSVTITEHYIGLERDRKKRDEIVRGARFLPPTAENVVELRKVNEA